MFLNHFQYYAPESAEEAFELAGRLGKKAVILAGGTDLLNRIKERLVQPECLIDINNVSAFQGIFQDGEKGIVIGAGTKITEIEHSSLIEEKYFALHQAAGELGSVQVRTMATIGGNSCHACPAAETPPPLVALHARVVLGSLSGERELPLENYILDNRETALAAGELLTKFILPSPPPHSASRYGYIGLRAAMEIDAVNMAVNLVLDNDRRRIRDARLVMGSVAPRPIVSSAVPAVLNGRELSADLVEKAAQAACGEASPISDIRASAEYRLEVVAVLARRLINEAYEAAREG